MASQLDWSTSDGVPTRLEHVGWRLNSTGARRSGAPTLLEHVGKEPQVSYDICAEFLLCKPFQPVRECYTLRNEKPKDVEIAVVHGGLAHLLHLLELVSKLRKKLGNEGRILCSHSNSEARNRAWEAGGPLDVPEHISPTFGGDFQQPRMRRQGR